MRGDVSLENNGGFVQMALDLALDGGVVDAHEWTGIEIDVFGNDERYNLHLRTADVVRPWQSYRAEFVATPEWRTIRLPFAAFEAHRIDAPLDLARLRRLGIFAIGPPSRPTSRSAGCSSSGSSGGIGHGIRAALPGDLRETAPVDVEHRRLAGEPAILGSLGGTLIQPREGGTGSPLRTSTKSISRLRAMILLSTPLSSAWSDWMRPA